MLPRVTVAVQRGQSGTELPSHPPSRRPPGSYLLGQRPQAPRTTGSRLHRRLSHHLRVQGAEELGRWPQRGPCPLPTQALPARGGRLVPAPRATPSRTNSRRRAPSPLTSGSPYLDETQEPRQGCQEEQLGRRRRRRHPRSGPPPAREGGGSARGPAPPRPPPRGPARPRGPRARARSSGPPDPAPRAPGHPSSHAPRTAPDRASGRPAHAPRPAPRRAALTPPPPRPCARPAPPLRARLSLRRKSFVRESRSRAARPAAATACAQPPSPRLSASGNRARGGVGSLRARRRTRGGGHAPPANSLQTRQWEEGQHHPVRAVERFATREPHRQPSPLLPSPSHVGPGPASEGLVPHPPHTQTPREAPTSASTPARRPACAPGGTGHRARGEPKASPPASSGGRTAPAAGSASAALSLVPFGPLFLGSPRGFEERRECE